MATLREVRRRISSVTNIAQITRAMQMVAASRMKRAQDAILAARPYSDELRQALARVAGAVGADVDPLLDRRPVRRVGLIVITTDRGLVGSLNANAVRAVLRHVAEEASLAGEEAEVSAITVGRKGRDALRRAGVPIAAHFAQLGDRPGFADITPIARLVTEDFLAGTYDRIEVAYSTFINTLSQRPVVVTVLPVEQPGMGEAETETNDEYLFEPSPEAVLSRLLPHFVAIDIYRAVLENRASEQSAQMVAMRSATDNANELIGDLTLVYNKTRQANITREMTEIASGAEALG
ncbi:MAG TPA: ATP synthase F1 subunit gamma [Candidatus Limnocylindria bacterium]|nr:ATP synthase F1 subunit gamma [Candidatus Limnocylindria bacterium]